MLEQANFERLIPMNRHRNSRQVAGLDINMVAPLDAFLFEEPSKFFPRDAFHTATSRILSPVETSCAETSTDKQASTAS